MPPKKTIKVKTKKTVAIINNDNPSKNVEKEQKTIRNKSSKNDETVRKTTPVKSSNKVESNKKLPSKKDVTPTKIAKPTKKFIKKVN